MRGAVYDVGGVKRGGVIDHTVIWGEFSSKYVS